MDPVQAIREGAAILETVVAKHGFAFNLRKHGPSSGGPFAEGEFLNGERRLEFHFRHSLGLVRYHVGSASLTHEEFLKGLGVWGRHRYPGFTDDPLEPFRQLRDDLAEFAADFLEGRVDGFKAIASR